MPTNEIKCKKCGKKFKNITLHHKKTNRSVCDECKYKSQLKYVREQGRRKKAQKLKEVNDENRLYK